MTDFKKEFSQLSKQQKAYFAAIVDYASKHKEFQTNDWESENRTMLADSGVSKEEANAVINFIDRFSENFYKTKLTL